jgi:hypothetical protein
MMSGIVEKLLRMDKSQRRTKKHFVRRRRSHQKRKSFTRKELIDFLRDKGIRSAYKLKKLRCPCDPEVYDYVKEFGSWTNVKICVWGDLTSVVAAPLDDPSYHIRVVREYGLYTAEAYRAARKRNPELIPSFKKIITQWGLFSNLREATLRSTVKGNLVVFLRLWEKLGKIPTVKDCKLEFVDLDEIASMFGSMSGLKSFLAFCDKRRGINAVR